MSWIKRKDREPEKIEGKQILVATWIVDNFHIQHVSWFGHEWRVCNDGDSNYALSFTRWMEIPSPGRPTKEERG
jgi:hypothetical protein